MTFYIAIHSKPAAPLLFFSKLQSTTFSSGVVACWPMWVATTIRQTRRYRSLYPFCLYFYTTKQSNASAFSYNFPFFYRDSVIFQSEASRSFFVVLAVFLFFSLFIMSSFWIEVFFGSSRCPFHCVSCRLRASSNRFLKATFLFINLRSRSEQLPLLGFHDHLAECVSYDNDRLNSNEVPSVLLFKLT